jgi:hypothetical protein
MSIREAGNLDQAKCLARLEAWRSGDLKEISETTDAVLVFVV